MVSNPCWPRRISRTRLKIPTQIMGVMSTPPMGGTSFRKGIKNGSVGQAIKLKGKRFRFTCGYQVRMMRNINKNVISPKIGPRIQAVRSTPVIGLSNYLRINKTLGRSPANFKLCKALSFQFYFNREQLGTEFTQHWLRKSNHQVWQFPPRGFSRKYYTIKIRMKCVKKG